MSVLYGCIHHTASSEMTREQLKSIELNNGFSDIPYHWIIHRNGIVELGRPESVKNAANYGLNGISVSVALLGYFHDDSLGKKVNMLTPTDAQLNSLYKVIEGWTQRYSGITICRHRDVKDIANKVLKLSIAESQMATACPGSFFPSAQVKTILTTKGIKVYWK